jgi:transcriptional regulator with XRE-family HTH domain
VTTQATNFTLAERLRLVRIALYGDDDDAIRRLAAALQISPAAWERYENGMMMPATHMLHFINLTNAHPRWLLDGQGPINISPLN